MTKRLRCVLMIFFLAGILVAVGYLNTNAAKTYVGKNAAYNKGSLTLRIKDVTSGQTTTGVLTVSRSKAPSVSTITNSATTWNCSLAISGTNYHNLKLNQTKVTTKKDLYGQYHIVNFSLSYTQHANYQHSKLVRTSDYTGGRMDFKSYAADGSLPSTIINGVVDTNTARTVNWQVNIAHIGLRTSNNYRYTGASHQIEYTRPAYTVTFSDGAGSTLKTQSVLRGASATAPANPTKSGYVFAGWDKGYSNIKVNTTVNAVWTPIYTVTFTDGHGGVITTQSVIKGNSATAPATPTRTGYDFAGWDRSYTNVTGNITVNATWTPKKVTYTFDGNGGTGTMSNLVVSYGGSGTLPSNAFTRKGYVFQGWSTSKRGTVEYQDKETVTNQKDSHSNVTLYAIWRKTNTSFSTIRVKEDDNVFTNDEKLTGGNGTAYDAGQTDSEYARTDTNEYPGYFSTK